MVDGSILLKFFFYVLGLVKVYVLFKSNMYRFINIYFYDLIYKRNEKKKKNMNFLFDRIEVYYFRYLLINWVRDIYMNGFNKM